MYHKGVRASIFVEMLNCKKGKINIFVVQTRCEVETIKY